MGCFQGQKLTPEFSGPESQKQMYDQVARMLTAMMGNYKSPPMYSQGPSQGQTAGYDYVLKQLGLPGYQQQGFYTMPSKQVQMPGAASPTAGYQAQPQTTKKKPTQ